jgi:hypothetical protein
LVASDWSLLLAFAAEPLGGLRRRLVSAWSERRPSLVGREREVAMLMKRFASGRERDGRAGLIAGEAGVGKLRLLRTLRADVAKLTRRHRHWISRASK